MKESKMNRPSDEQKDEMTEDEIDESLEESFPASDPPSWTLGHESHGETDKDENEKVESR